MLSVVFVVYWLVGFAFNVAAVIIGLWIWNRGPVLAGRAPRT
jgi:hypothetical protein